jgi:type II secretion system protein J
LKVGADLDDEERGFTLVETLVALALLSLMSVFAINSISAMIQLRKVETQIEEQGTIEAVERHLRQTITDTRVAFAAAPGESPKLVFSGNHHVLEIVAPVSDQLARGGLFRLSYEKNDDDQFLVSYEAFRPQAGAATSRSEVLVHGVKNAAFRYFGKTVGSDAAIWVDNWQQQNALPQAIAIEFEFLNPQSEHPAPMVIAVAGGY